jgi:hypothetical protein
MVYVFDLSPWVTFIVAVFPSDESDVVYEARGDAVVAER